MINKLLSVILITFIVLTQIGLSDGIRSKFNPMGVDLKPDVTDGLVSWWKLETDANDSVGDAHFSVVGATNAVVQGRACYGFGNFTYLEIPKEKTIQLTNDVSFTFFYNRSIAALYQMIIGAAGNGGYPYMGWGVGNEGAAGFLAFFADGIDGAAGEMRIYIAAPPVNEWHFVAVTSGGGNMSLYFDDTGFLSAPLAPVTETNNNFRIGQKVGFNPFEGFVSQVRCYERVLSSNEVNTIYNRYK